MPTFKSDSRGIDPEAAEARAQQELKLAREQLGPDVDPHVRRGTRYGKDHVTTLATSGTAEDLSILNEVADRARARKLDYNEVIMAAAKALATQVTPEADRYVRELLKKDHFWQGTQATLVEELTLRAKGFDSDAADMIDDAFATGNRVVRSLIITSALRNNYQADRFLMKGLRDENSMTAAQTLERIEEGGRLQRSSQLQREYLRIASGRREVQGFVREAVINQLAGIARHPDVTGVLRQLSRSGELPYREMAAKVLRNEGLLEEAA